MACSKETWIRRSGYHSAFENRTDSGLSLISWIRTGYRACEMVVVGMETGSPGGPRFDISRFDVVPGFMGGKLRIRFIRMPQHWHFGIPGRLSARVSSSRALFRSVFPASNGTPV